MRENKKKSILWHKPQCIQHECQNEHRKVFLSLLDQQFSTHQYKFVVLRLNLFILFYYLFVCRFLLSFITSLIFRPSAENSLYLQSAEETLV